MFVMAAVNHQRASRVDEYLCVIDRLNNGKTQANISSQKQNKITSYMHHTSPANPTATEEPNFISARIQRILGAVDDHCHKLVPRLITYATPLYVRSG